MFRRPPLAWVRRCLFPALLALFLQVNSSTAQDNQAELTFSNRTARAVQVFWVNGGREISYKVLRPNESFKQGTVVGHQWVIRDQATGRELHRLTATRSEVITVTGDAGSRVHPARAILDAYHGQAPQPATRKLHVIYFTPLDKEPSADWQGRVQRVMEHIRDFYSREMARHGFPGRSIQLDYDANNKLIIHLVRGRLTLARYNSDSGGAIRDEARGVLIPKGIDADRETILIFCNLATVTNLSVSSNSPYYGGGNARAGTAWLNDSQFLDAQNLSKKEPTLQDGQYGAISLGRYNTIFIGGTAHELGHALGLPHDRESTAEAFLGTSLMGSGNRTYGEELRGEGKGSFLSHADALRLASHPMFSGSGKGLRDDVTARFAGLQVQPQASSFVITGRVESSLPCYAVVGYLDPVGGGDYDARTCTAVPDGTGGFTLNCRDLVAGKPAELRLVACLVNGLTFQQAYPYRVTTQGRPVLDDLRVTLLLEPALAALGQRDRTRFEAAVTAATSGLDAADPVLTWAGYLRDAFDPPPLPAPEALPAATTDVPLSNCVPGQVRVGYGQPKRNQWPRDNGAAFLSAGGQRSPRGLYAHAVSSYQYNLGGKWQRLAGRAGLQDGAYGSVVFVIKGDGRELFRSATVRGSTVVDYAVNVQGVRDLELVVEDAGDGIASDWGAWLDPRLSR